MTFQLSQIIFAILAASVLIMSTTNMSSRANAAPAEELRLWQGTVPGSEGYDQQEVFDPREVGNGWVTGVNLPTLTITHPSADNRSGTGVVICPGGGYGGLSIEKEGHALAAWFVERGVVAGVLKYRHGGGQHQHPVPLDDAQRAMRIMRTHAKEWQLDLEKIGIAGFSAGGHLASSVGTHYDEGDAAATDPIERASCRANFTVLIYPVITMQAGLTHQGSRNNFLGKQPTEEMVDLFSNELQVTTETGPSFLVHAADDEAVPVENSLLFYQALLKKKVPVEMHLYETGGHGFGFYRRDLPVDCWPELLEGWLKGRKLIR